MITKETWEKIKKSKFYELEPNTEVTFHTQNMVRCNEIINNIKYVNKIIDIYDKVKYLGIFDFDTQRYYSLKEYINKYESCKDGIGLCISLSKQRSYMYMHFNKIYDNKMELFFGSHCTQNESDTYIMIQ